jgi:hypothetical protein
MGQLKHFTIFFRSPTFSNFARGLVSGIRKVVTPRLMTKKINSLLYFEVQLSCFTFQSLNSNVLRQMVNNLLNIRMNNRYNIFISLMRHIVKLSKNVPGIL